MMLNSKNMYNMETDKWGAEYVEGFIFLDNKVEKQSGLIKLVNSKGKSISLGQFNSGCKTHSFDRACEVFWKLRAKEALGELE